MAYLVFFQCYFNDLQYWIKIVFITIYFSLWLLNTSLSHIIY